MAADATAVSTAVCSAAGGAAVSTVAGSRQQAHGGSRCHGKSPGDSPTAAGATAAISGSKLGSRCHGKFLGDCPTAAAQRRQAAQKK